MKPNNITGNAKEYNELSEITDVTFENNRLVLRVDDPISARKFGLSDKTWRYEFDGTMMFWFYKKEENEPSSWSCQCGKGGHTLVDGGTENQIRTVKSEMAKQIVAKGMLDYFGGDKHFTNVAIELREFVYNRDGSLRLRG